YRAAARALSHSSRPGTLVEAAGSRRRDAGCQGRADESPTSPISGRTSARQFAQLDREVPIGMRRAFAAVCLALTLYYARFFVAVRSDGSTLLQIALLLCAAAVLAWRPVRIEVTSRWVAAGGVLLLGAIVFLLADHDSHSASDTL